VSAAREGGRKPDQLRAITFEPDFLENPHGSVVITQGRTKVLCTAMVDEDVPRWMRNQGRGWITAEYSLLPASTGDRVPREAARGKQQGRTVEIQRLIGRAVRAVADFEALGERTLWLDCDVLQADGGTRCAAICGAYVAAMRSTASGSPALFATPSPPSRSASSMARRCSISTTRRTRTPTRT
jgi:ribonuclease PH